MKKLSLADKTSDPSLSDHNEIYFDNKGDLSIISRGNVVSVRRLVSELSRIKEINPSISNSSDLKLSISPSGLSIEPKSDTGLNYEELKEINKMKDIYLYNSSKYSFDVLTDSITFDLIENNKYTNTVDLGDIIKKSEQDKANALVNFTVFYSISGAINSKSFTFNLNSDNFANDIRGEVSVEYIDGIVRVVPIDKNIDECIINNCEITYGGI